MKLSKTIIGVFCYVILLSVNQGCTVDEGSAAAQESKNPTDEEDSNSERTVTIVLPEGIEPVLFTAINENDNIVFFDDNGKQLPRCRFCDQKLIDEYNLDPTCEDAGKKGVEICEGTINTTVLGQTSLSFWRTSGSFCFGSSGLGGDNNGVNCVRPSRYCPNHRNSSICRHCRQVTCAQDRRCCD